MTALATGLHDLAREQYDAIDAVSASFLKALDRSPAHALASRSAPPTKPQALGTAKHLLTLEPDKAKKELVIYPKRRSGKEWEAFEAANEGRTILTAPEWEEVQRCAEAVRKHPLARRLLAEGRPEASIIWEADGVPAKSRLDWLGPAHIVDLKFSRDASPRGFPREAAKYGLPLQAAFYGDAVKYAGLGEHPFYVVAVESAPPWGVTVWKLPQETLELGRSTYRRLLRQYAYCKETNDWPGYPEAELTLNLPQWAYMEESDD